MVDWKSPMARVSRRTRITTAAIGLLALGAAGGAGAVSLTRPAIEMAPTVPTAIGRLPQTRGIVTVKGRVAEIYGDRFVVQDASGRTLVDAGRGGQSTISTDSGLTVQGHYENGQLRASYLIDAQGQVEVVGGRQPLGGPGGLRGPGGPHADGPLPPPPPPGSDALPLPPRNGVAVPPTSTQSSNPPPSPMNGTAPTMQSTPAVEPSVAARH